MWLLPLVYFADRQYDFCRHEGASGKVVPDDLSAYSAEYQLIFVEVRKDIRAHIISYCFFVNC